MSTDSGMSCGAWNSGPTLSAWFLQQPAPTPTRYQRRTRPPTEWDLLRPGAARSPAADKRVVMASVPGDCVRRLKRWGSCCLPDTSGRLQANRPQTV